MSMTSPNGGINPRQNFVQPGQGNAGSWLGKIFGGIAANRQARDYTQMRADLMMLNHDLTKEQMTHGAALKDFGASEGAKRARKETAWHDKQNVRQEIWKQKEIGKAKVNGIEVNPDKVDRNAGFDKNGMPIRQKRSQVTYPDRPQGNNTAGTTITDSSGNPPTPPGGGNPPVAGGGAVPAKPRKKTPVEPAAAPEPSTGLKQPGLKSPGLDNVGLEPTAPAAKPARVSKPRTPKTPKAGA